jgi:hypothetical protein
MSRTMVSLPEPFTPITCMRASQSSASGLRSNGVSGCRMTTTLDGVSKKMKQAANAEQLAQKEMVRRPVSRSRR